MNGDITREEILELRKRIARLFQIDMAGNTENYLKALLKIRTPKMYHENSINMAPLLQLCEMYRSLAPYALPNGETLDFTRAEIETYFGEPMDWNKFCGLDKNIKTLPPIEFFRNYDKAESSQSKQST